jgi:MFS transporter, DHA3 family, macrolide efflux protein
MSFVVNTDNPRRLVEKRLHNITVFVIIWLRQFVSMAGSFILSFALDIWVWQKIRSTQALAQVGILTRAPLIIVIPLVDTLVDRWDRKLMMMLSNLGAVLSSVVIFILFTSGWLRIWQIHATTAFASAFRAFQWLPFRIRFSSPVCG